jgi:hypothetical protein
MRPDQTLELLLGLLAPKLGFSLEPLIDRRDSSEYALDV